MRRVHAAHGLRMLFSNAALALALFALALWGVGREVWVARVFQNAPHHGILEAARFFTYAFLDTRLVVQVLCLAVLFAFIWLIRDLARAMGTLSFTSVRV
jgi:hypothetical protein